MTKTRILMIKHGALGDVIQGLDAYAGLRAGHPDAIIAALTTPAFAPLFEAMPWFDEVIIDRRSSALNVRATMRIRGILRDGWDMILDLQCSKRTAWYHRSLAGRGGRWFGTAAGASDPYPDFSGVNNADRMKIAAKMAGGTAVDAAGMEWLAQNGLPEALTTKLAPDAMAQALVLVPGCSPAKPSKRWSPSRFAALASLMRADGREVIIVGTDADRAAADAVLREAPYCRDFVGRTNLGQLASLFSRVGMVVGNDTGPVFMAARTGVPTLMIMGRDTEPAMSSPVGAHAGWLREDNIDAITSKAAADALAGLAKPGRS